MIQSRSTSIDDPSAACPVSLEVLGQLSRADPRRVPDIVADIPEATRARLAVYLYGRSHTHELGIRIAATCEDATLQRTAGIVGSSLYAQSRKPYVLPAYGTSHAAPRRKVSLGGSARP
ncbi:hypothetical protein OPKNFCMD_1773 [Methylobacterium crusticola]|uniref:Uncharacterized protein n=1 Tax=Methylobacterium crusticola TaxID=1697972 RepID=A0ABQ4QVT5_9HYPH|nr:hypothetical protein [Methylobacterium crusticola]GJD49044.1 hypothetical protein OPKNFCMD_1773 [Methylobacterium crusticola]